MSPERVLAVHRDMTDVLPLTEAQLALLDRYLANDCSDDERARAVRLLHESPALARRVSAIAAVMAQGSPRVSTEQSWQTLRAELVRPEPVVSRATKQRPHTNISWRWVGAAFVALIGIVGVSTGWLSRVWGPRTSFQPAQHYATGAGQISHITLTDGSRVVLAPHTTLTVANDNGTRSMTLHGAAMFDIQSAVKMPCVIRVANTEVRVIGTSFAIQHYTDEATTSVAVVSGKVSVRAATRGDSSRAAILTAGTVAEVSDSTVVATTPGDVGKYTEWTDGALVLRNTPIRDVLWTLERWYDLRFRVTDSTIFNGHLSGTIPYTNADDMLTSLQTLLRVTMTFDGKTVTLRPQRLGVQQTPTRRAVRDSLMDHSTKEAGR